MHRFERERPPRHKGRVPRPDETSRRSRRGECRPMTWMHEEREVACPSVFKRYNAADALRRIGDFRRARACQRDHVSEGKVPVRAEESRLAHE